MPFEHVSIAAIEHIDAPHRVTSAAIGDRLMPTLSRLGVRPELLESLSGIVARRYWDEGVTPSQVATRAAEMAIEASGVGRDRIGLVVNTSVCKDFIEPSVASMVHGNLGLSANCLNFDLGNACLAFMNGMDVVGHMIERGAIDFGLVVDGEGSRQVTEATIERLLGPETDEQSFRDQFAALTLGSGAAAMVLGRSDLLPGGHRYLGGVSRAATEHSGLCQGQVDRMYTDTRKLLMAGLQLAGQTWSHCRHALDWRAEDFDAFVLHQVSRVHTEQLAATLGLDLDKALTIYAEFGNIGPASVPIVLSKMVKSGQIREGSRVALMGIGSGLNCAMAEVIW